MIPPPSSFVSSSASLTFDPTETKLTSQMQNMKLAPPLPHSQPNSSSMMPGTPSPQHTRSPNSTNVTYSGTPKATYPYINNNLPPGNIRPGGQQPLLNNNQYSSSIQQPFPPNSSNQLIHKGQTGGHVQTYSQSSASYSNGFSNGHGDIKSNQENSAQNFQSLGQAPVTQQNYGSQSTSLPPQTQAQFQQSHLGSPRQPIPGQPFQNSYMNHGPSRLPNSSIGQPMQTNFQQGSSQPPGMNISSPISGSSQVSSMPPPPGGVAGQSWHGQSGPHPSSPYPSGPPGASHQGGPPGASYQGGPPGPPNQIGSPYQTGPPGAPFQSGPPGAPFQSGPSNAPFQTGPPGAFQSGSPGPSYQSGPSNPYGMPNQGVQQPRKLELDQMPSVVQVREEDQKTRSGLFTTDTKGLVPPLVTTDFTVQDRGMCSPRFIRSTLYCLPNQPDILKQTAIPFSITINPMATLYEGESEPYRCLYREQGPLRCKRCKAYICPFMTFMEGGRCFQCAFCKVVTEVPQDYFCFLDGMGERTDKYHRPELCFGSYEYVATKDYCRKEELPNPPAYIFMIEVSNATFRNGLVPLLCENMKNVLHTLKTDEKNDTSKLRVGFVTYNNVLHFYNMKKNLTQPHIMVLSDVHNAFVPLLEGFLVTLSEAEALVDSLMEHIPRLFMNEPASEVILGPVIQVGLEALKNANCSGKLLVFHSTIPNAEAPGKLTHREGQKLLGTDKQKIALAPQTDFYGKLAQDCVAAGCAVDLYLFPSAYIDIASLGPLCRHTGGQMYKYTYFQSHIDGDRFLEDLERNITTTTAFDAVLRVRTSAGISPVFYYGNFYMSNATDIELSAIDCHKAITVELAYDDKLPENETVFIQAALLYTTITGERLIRVHNLAIPTSVSMPDVFKCSELDTIINFFAKQALKQLLDHSPQQIKNNLLSRSVKILSCYRKHCATNSSSAQLILPEALKLLPLMINCLLRSDAIAGGSDMSLDDRCFSIVTVNSMDVKSTATYFYPTLIPLHEVNPDADELPNSIRCSIEKLHDNGAYLLENGMYMFLWIGQAISSEWLQNVLGVQSTNLIDKQKTSLPELNTPLSKRIRQIIEDLEEGRQWYMRLTVMVQGDKLEVVFRQFLVEDRGVDGSPSYVDFLCHLHREISKSQ